MPDIKTSFENLTGVVKNYLNTSRDLLVMTASDKVSKIITAVITAIVTLLLSLFFLFFISFGFAVALGEMMDKMYAGFLIVAGIYLLIGLILFFVKRKVIQEPILLKLVNEFRNAGKNE